MIKKYEIINDGDKKRIKALRSFHVQGRYVNIGDVGGIVYDENTLSQEGNCWIFSGNLNYPSIRVGGDSIVDTNGYEAEVTDPRPFVNVTGASALIGAHDFVTSAPSVEAYLDINDSRIEFQYTSAMTVATKVIPGSAASGVLKSVIDTSNVIISKTGNGAFAANIFADITQCNVAFTTVNAGSTLAGIFENVKNLTYNGSILAEYSLALRRNLIVSGCDNFALSTTMFTTAAVNAANAANMPFIFTRCNVPNGMFYHNAAIKNTYTDIDFAKALVDLGKPLVGSGKLVSSEVEGMYRVINSGTGAYGGLVESHESVASLSISDVRSTYGTTIYKDIYFNGLFDFAGTNVFGNRAPGHPRARVLNVQPRAVQGNFNTVIVGQTVTGVTTDKRFCVIPIPLRVNGSNGITVQGLPGNLKALAMFVTPKGVIRSTDVITGAALPASKLPEIMAYIRFGNVDNASPVTPEDLAGVTVTVYNGCKIVNTGETAVNMKGNIRVEDNATLVNASVTGSGYFGGNSVTYYNPTEWAPLDFVGTVFMKDIAVFAPTALTGACALVRMEGNAKFIGSVATPSTNLSFIMRDNAVIEGISNTRSGVVMSGNAKVTSTGVIAATSRGVLVMEDNASIEADTTVIGAITLSGNYKGNAAKTWVGKRTITDVNSPEYDNNVKTQYDF